jgi:hypothetical protein
MNGQERPQAVACLDELQIVARDSESALSRRALLVRIAVFCLPILLTAGFLLLKLRWNATYVALVQEDALVENGQCLVYGAGAIMALVAGWRALRRGGRLLPLLLLVLGVFLLFVCLEEISWGQRIFAVRTPEWFQENNAQEELNVHNLKPVQRTIHFLYTFAGFVLSFGWIGARLVSAVTRLSPRLKATIRLFAPGWYLMPFFIPLSIVYACFSLCNHKGEMLLALIGLKPPTIGGFLTYRDQEPAELLLALGMLALVTVITLKLNRTPAPTVSNETPESADFAD